MASIKPRKNKDGIITSYTISVLRGRNQNGKQIFSRRSYPDKKRGESIPTGWSQKRIEKEVERVAVLFEEECKAGAIPTEKVRFDDYARYFIDVTSASGKHKNNTSSNYLYYLERINDASLNGIGQMYLTDIKTTHINKFYTSLLNDAVNGNTGKGLSANTVKHYHRFISSVMTFACREGKITINPCKTAMEIVLEKKEAEVISEDNLPLVIRCMETYELKMRIVFYILLTTGLRIGEALGIRYRDIDFETGIVKVSNNVQYAQKYETGKYELYIETLKNREKKSVMFPPYLISLIKQQAEQEKIINLNNDYFVTHNKKDFNVPLYPSTVRKALREYNKRGIITEPVSIEYFNNTTHQNEIITYQQAQPIRFVRLVDNQYKVQIGEWKDNNYCYIPKKYVKLIPENLKPHKFRHTCASVLLYQHLDIVTVSRILGHKQVSTTMNTYAHIMKEVDERSADIMENIIQENRVQRNNA